jgi:hypothetical protein
MRLLLSLLAGVASFIVINGQPMHRKSAGQVRIARFRFFAFDDLGAYDEITSVVCVPAIDVLEVAHLTCCWCGLNLLFTI